MSMDATKAWIKMRRLATRLVFIAAGAVAALGLLAGCQDPKAERTNGTEKKGGTGAQSRTCDWTVSYEVVAPVRQAASSFLVLVNGFPVYAEAAKGPGGGYEISAPLNTGLTEGQNELLFELRPRLLHRGGETLSIGEARWKARVLGCYNRTIAQISASRVDSTYRAWKKRVQARWNDYLGELPREEAFDSTQTWAHRHPMTVTATFDNEHGPDFSRVFEEAPRLAETPATRKRLKEYAMRLRDWMAEKDTSALFEAFRFRYAQEYVYSGVSGSVSSGSVSEDSLFLRKAVVMKELELDFGRSDIDLQKWSGGRVWEVTRNGKPFFDGAEGIREVYVAEIDGKLRVVRGR